MSALFHLVEAATTLSQLGQSDLSPSTAYRAAASSSSAVSSSTTPTSPVRAAAPSFVSDDDENLANREACAKIAILRENHLKALRVAAANAGLVTTTTPSVASTPAAAGYPTTNGSMPMALAAPTPLAIATPTTTVYSNKHATTTSLAGAAMSPPRSGGVVVTGDSASATPRDMFPLRLHALLADPTVRDVISWLPHGRSFVVLRPDVFASRVLPRYFAPEGSSGHHRARVASAPVDATPPQPTEGAPKYPSFTRKLNRWGFRQISRGPDAGAFCHDLFQRDDVGLCRGMICQKSRKSFMSSSSSSSRSGGQIDDVMSVSSASTMGTRSVASFGNNRHPSGEKRLYSSTVTVSTAGQNNNNGNACVSISNKSLPFKKRKSTGQHVATMNDIPSMISHGYQKMSSSTSSMTESDLTSDNGSVSSVGNNNGNKNSVFSALKVFPTIVAPFGNSPIQAAEALAREALARHFHEQHRAFALASLLENSRLAIEAAGMAAKDQQESGHQNPPPLATAVAVPLSSSLPPVGEERNAPAAVLSAEAARAALYKAYMQAMNSDNAAAMASSSSSSSSSSAAAAEAAMSS
ncbi:hypothetical protein ACHAXA_007662 [Cyclostephanos tholiformis]|uniref:HSF-type DNA-binding domain-containing protein n=1 Tax=Cyclostephanos tholiformis TaxID=382380 RepID=A0ABD3SDR7_9STRA